jgi:small subunit ribosomal protein S16
VAVRIRLKRMGRTHRPFYRVCAMDSRSPRDGRAIEELGHYDPMVGDTDARAVLNKERIDHWISVGAKPSDNVRTLIKKYGTNGTHLQQQEDALQRLVTKKPVEIARVPSPKPAPDPEPVAEEAATEEATTDEVPATEAGDESSEAAATEAPASEKTTE